MSTLRHHEAEKAQALKPDRLGLKSLETEKPLILSFGFTGCEISWQCPLAGDLGSIPGLGRSPGEGKGYPLQYSDLENSMDCTVHEVAKSWTRLSNFRFHWLQVCIFNLLQSSDWWGSNSRDEQMGTKEANSCSGGPRVIQDPAAPCQGPLRLGCALSISPFPCLAQPWPETHPLPGFRTWPTG